MGLVPEPTLQVRRHVGTGKVAGVVGSLGKLGNSFSLQGISIHFDEKSLHNWSDISGHVKIVFDLNCTVQRLVKSPD